MWRRDSAWLVSTKAQHSINWHDSTHLWGQHCRDAGRHATQHYLPSAVLTLQLGSHSRCPLHTHKSYCPYGLTPMSVPLHTWFTVSPDLHLSLCNAKAQTQASHVLHMLNKHSPTAASFLFSQDFSQPKMALNFWSSCVYFQNAENTACTAMLSV